MGKALRIQQKDATGLLFVLAVCLGQSASADDITSEPLYVSGAGEVCGSTPLSCRHAACGRDESFEVQTVSCTSPIPNSASECSSTSPVSAVRDKLNGLSIAAAEDFKDVYISSSDGRCVWSQEEFYATAIGLPDQDGFYCVNDFDAEQGCNGGLQISQNPTIIKSCRVSFGIYAACPNVDVCGSEFLTCNSIVFGLNRNVMKELSPSIANERIFRNLLGAILSNFSTGLLSSVKAHELSEDAEAAFYDVDELSRLLVVEQNREEAE